MSDYEQDDEYLERLRLYAGGVYHRLVKEVVDQLREAEYRYEDDGECPETYVQADRDGAAVFEDEAEHRAQSAAEERSDVWYDVEYAGHEGYTERSVDSEAGDEPEAEEVDQGHTCHFYHHADEVSREEVADV